jgi:hypothetical protein
MELIQTLCTNHSFARLLTLFRKVPHEAAIDVLHTSGQSKGEETILFRAIYPEAVLFGTNCILKFCRHGPDFTSNNERYRFAPTEEELEDAVRLLLLCVVHRYELFYMNTIIRSNLVEPVALGPLVDIYNQRLRRRWKPTLTVSGSNTIIIPGQVHESPWKTRILEFRDSGGTQLSLMMRNYWPIPCSAEAEIQRFGYLDTPDFQKFTGFSFAVFQKVWVGLNEVLAHHLPMLWPDGLTERIDPEVLMARLQQADDYCESALGGGGPESIWKSCHGLLAQKSTFPCPTEDECRKVVDFLTYRRFDGDVRLIEQPVVF